jgi:hypothetical protein
MTDYNRNPTGKGGFKKGQSANPGGRPKQLADVVEAYRAESDANRRKLVAIRDGEKSTDGDRLRAIAMMEDRAWGKPIQATLNAQSSYSEAFLEFLRSIDGESRRLPRGNDPDADREYDAAQAQRAQGGHSAV